MRLLFRWVQKAASCPNNWRAVMTAMSGSNPDGQPIKSSSPPCCRSQTIWSTARSCHHRKRSGMMATIHTSLWRLIKAHPRSPTPPMQFPKAGISGWMMLLRLAGPPVTTTRKWASRPAAAGKRLNVISVKWTAIFKRSRLPPLVSATCQVMCSATACCCQRKPV